MSSGTRGWKAAHPGAAGWSGGVCPVVLTLWLRGNPGERDRYAVVKRQAAFEADAGR
jgi:GrpB-like predicted nucleotidyltransferase (UPF0157 family)